MLNRYVTKAFIGMKGFSVKKLFGKEVLYEICYFKKYISFKLTISKISIFCMRWTKIQFIHHFKILRIF